MNSYEKIHQLKADIEKKLTPLINQTKCILVGAPYYHNIGDHLIWRGIRDFFDQHNLKCLHTFSCFHHPQVGSIDKDCIIFYIGGGNIGDLYLDFSKQLANVVQLFPDNRIIVFPQTIYYDSKTNEKYYLNLFASHKDLHFCARDKTTLQILSDYFQDSRVLLVPDMAYYINLSWLSSFKKATTKEVLIINRTDNEVNTSYSVKEEEDVSDWPTYENKLMVVNINLYFIRIHFYHIPLRSAFDWCWNAFQIHYFNKRMIKYGVSFISNYQHIKTTRLHGAILAMLINKKVTIWDNSYGKNKHFYETWLHDVDQISLETP